MGRHAREATGRARGGRPRSWRVGLAAALALCLLGAPGLAPGAPADSFTPDGAAAELVRLLNGERAAAGLPQLATDSFLAVKARDGAVDCPNGVATVAGRAKDMALSGFFSHDLRLCGTNPATGHPYSALDAMLTWGYTSARGEIIAMNGGYGYGASPYHFGCAVSGSDYRTGDNCSGGSTTAPSTVTVAAGGFMTSPGHRAIILSTDYDRFACGAWQAADGDAYYACMYAFGPGTEPGPTPTPSPDPTPTPTPDPDAIVVQPGVALQTTGTATTPVRLGWSGGGVGPGTTVEVQRSVDGGSYGLLATTAATALTTSASYGRLYRYRVRLADPGGPGPWGYSAPVRPALLSETSASVRYTGTWLTQLSSAALGGRRRYTTRPGASATTTVSARSIAWVAARGSTRGSARVYVDGAYAGTVNLHASATKARQVVFTRSWPVAGIHVIRIVAVGTSGHPRIDVDGFVRIP